MNARRAARELVQLTLFQTKISKKDFTKFEINDFIDQAVRTLSEETNEILNKAKGQLIKADEQLHEAGLRINTDTIKNMLSDTIETTHQALELLYYCNGWPLLFSLAIKNEVRDFAIKLIMLFQEHNKEINEIIEKSIVDWTVESMLQMDRNIISIAVTEIMYDNAVPQVAIDEAVEIAKKYGTDDSGSFVNGVLNRVLKTLGIEKQSD